MTDPAGVAAATAFRHSEFRTGYHTVTLGRNPAVPIVDSLLSSGRVLLGVFSCCSAQLPSVWRHAGGTGGFALRYGQVCATRPSVFAGVCRGCGPGVVESPELDAAAVCPDMSTITSRFSPLNPLLSPMFMENVDQMIVESPTSYDAPVVDLEISPMADHFAPLIPQESQVSHLSSVQPNRVRLDFDYDTLDVFPVLPMSPGTDGYLPCFVTGLTGLTRLTGCTGYRLSTRRGDWSRDSIIGSPATSLSKTDHPANLNLLSRPLIPLPDTVLLHTDPALLLELRPTTISIHRKGRFTRSTQCGLFVWCTCAPSSVSGVCGCAGVGPVTGRPPAEWLQVMDRRCNYRGTPG